MGGAGKTILIALIGLIVGAAGGVGYGMLQVDEVNQKLLAATQERDQAQQSADRLRKNNEDAAKKYGKELGKLVAGGGAPVAAAAPAQGQPAAAAAPAAPAADDPAKLIDSARAILAARDGFRASLDAARASMDSEFDALATELGAATPAADKIKQILDGLKQNWPAKDKEMETATRKLLVDLGVLQAPPAPKPAAAPASAAPTAVAPAPAPAAAPAAAPAQKK